MEKLKVHQLQQIIHRLQSGQSVRAVARDLSCARNTVRFYSRWAQSHGFLEAGHPLPTLPELDRLQSKAAKPRCSNISSVASYDDVIKEMLSQNAAATAILRRLRNSHGFTGSYSAVQRYVAQQRPSDVVVRVETAPGEVAQVDFGTVGKAWDPVRKTLRTAYCFVLTLCWSRHMFVRFVFDQTIPTWLECHRSAFEWFGGTPHEIVIDNLKSAVIVAALEDCVLSLPYERFARHYNCLVHPCRPGTPAHKGKVENGVGYVKGSFWQSEREGLDICEYNRRVLTWITEEAGLRTHGTTRVAPMGRFHSQERSTLTPLPDTPYDLEMIVRATVSRDCHVQVRGRYYSAPFQYVGSKLDVYVYHGVVQLFDGVNLIVTHERGREKGDRITRLEHYPADKSVYLIRTRSWCLEHASSVGPKCREVVQQLLENRPLDKLRAAQGIMSLTDKFGVPRVEAACARALHFGDPSYRRVKSILAAGTDQQPIDKTVQLHLVDYTFARGAHEFFGKEQAI